MSKIDPLLKTLPVRPSPPEALVQAYLIHIADKSDTNFRKILDLKGVRRADQVVLMDLFNAHKASPAHDALPAASALLSPLVIGSGAGSGSIGSLGGAGTGIGMGMTPALSGGRFDPAGLGNVMLGVVREGVDRFGSPALGAAEGGVGFSNAPAGQSEQGKLNENLKNIGRFFRRDTGFRGFGRSEEGR